MAELSPQPMTEQFFHLPGLQERRAHRTQRIAELLGSNLSGPAPTGTAVADAAAHHLLEGARRAAAGRAGELLSWYRRTELRDLAHLTFTNSDGRIRLLLHPPPSQLLQSPISDTAYYLIAPETEPAPATLHDLLTAALDSAHKHGFSSLIDQHAPIACVLEQRDLHATLFSWSITRLPGTVFTDYTNAAEVLARDLIHEAGHHWLNEALAIGAIALPDDLTFYSPWRAVRRPAFGFLHACWAFSLATIYSAAALDDAPSPVHVFLMDYLAEQRQLLRAALPAFAEAATLITSRSLHERVSSAVQTALHYTAEDH
ncbi:aKG-HExxH-type peptide beta-hydroxylase [Actinomadura harenae]|uniref:HEXXH motif domain-containing protein n=1 Tax=Actinomadura harenae TaxID=2483351 RepID=A0A3M2LJ63_9ACTN|nr:HEXXH motif-containing putative peptide modification protein [Actinomadura harenae]RMI37512.1 HEXXH motif domain-containing protein [Actinomadura harenae]